MSTRSISRGSDGIRTFLPGWERKGGRRGVVRAEHGHIGRLLPSHISLLSPNISTFSLLTYVPALPAHISLRSYMVAMLVSTRNTEIHALWGRVRCRHNRSDVLHSHVHYKYCKGLLRHPRFSTRVASAMGVDAESLELSMGISRNSVPSPLNRTHPRWECMNGGRVGGNPRLSLWGEKPFHNSQTQPLWR